VELLASVDSPAETDSGSSTLTDGGSEPLARTASSDAASVVVSSDAQLVVSSDASVAAPSDASVVAPSDASVVPSLEASTTDAASGDAGGDAALAPAPLLPLYVRYDFAGTGAVAIDRAGLANGAIVGGAALDGDGHLTLDGVDDFVDMPNRVVSGLTSLTVVSWLTWNEPINWVRLFSFGSTDAGEGNPGRAVTSFSLTLFNRPEQVPSVLFESAGQVEQMEASRSAPSGAPIQLAVSLDAAAGTTTLYLNGAEVAQRTMAGRVSSLDDVDNWIGRSHWVQDATLHARLDEFRIYARALSAAELAALYARGADVP